MALLLRLRGTKPSPRLRRTRPPANPSSGSTVADGVKLGLGGCIVMPLMLGLLVVLVLMLLVITNSF